ncbi:hypothetical protein ANRL3_01143 [Anaerolineae bacterium]|nr:hypothetical protein ANRL3_01143 [Anaerolineae bacterium]
MSTRKSIFALLSALALLTAIYAPTLLTNINGSSDDFMADTGETQIVLNVWGTLHATGYPLFVILGNLLTSAMKFVGIAPTLAPTLISLVWGLFALALVYALALHLTQRSLLAAIVTALFGLTRWVWIHNVIPEVYSFALFFLVLLFALTLWQLPIPHRLEWLALIGGIALAHHRGFILAVPFVVFAVWDELVIRIRRQPLSLLPLILLGIVGWIPYLYLPFRAQAGGIWVYGEPGTLGGFWDQVIARENPAIVRIPASFDIVFDKFNVVNTLLLTELTAFGVLLGLLGLAWAIYREPTRRAGMTFAIGAVSAYLFVVILFDDILAPVVYPITLSLVFGWVLLFDALLRAQRFAYAAILPLAAICAFILISQNSSFISDLTHDPTGVETLALAENAPAGSTLMLTWGTRYFAIGFAQDVLGKLQHFRRVDDKADLAAILARGQLVIPEFISPDRPTRWFESKLKQKVYARAVAPHLIQIDLVPERLETLDARVYDPALPIVIVKQTVNCFSDSIALQVEWGTLQKPSRDLSVFVHELDADGNVIAQADTFAPVYGWRPLTTWEAGEIVRDVYPLPRRTDAANLRFGLYEKMPTGEFKNYNSMIVPVPCASVIR